MIDATRQLPFTMAITALGGQGGGVLSTWLVEVAEASGYYGQTTSVPGVAQRTGATVYYLEFFPKGKNVDLPPVMSFVPVSDNVDVVVAAELMEATRAVERGYVNGKTTCIFSSHRVYSTHEKMVPGDGTVDAAKLLQRVQNQSKECLYFDMEALAADYGCHISTVLLGVIAASGILPFERSTYERVIKATNKAVERNLEGFNQSWKQVENLRGGDADLPKTDVSSSVKTFVLPKDTANRPETQAILRRIDNYPQRCHEYLYLGAQRLLDYQDYKYVNSYLDYMDGVLKVDNEALDYELTFQAARYLPLWMGFEDTIRVAERKTGRDHIDEARKEVRAATGQHVHLAEFMRPRVEEICGTLPKGLGNLILNSSFLSRLVNKMTGDKIYYSTKLMPFMALFLVSMMKPWRRCTYRYHVEIQEIESWLQTLTMLAESHYSVAIEVVKCQRLIKGYGDTHERGMKKFKLLMNILDELKNDGEGHKKLMALSEVALQEVSADRLEQAIAEMFCARQVA